MTALAALAGVVTGVLLIGLTRALRQRGTELDRLERSLEERAKRRH